MSSRPPRSSAPGQPVRLLKSGLRAGGLMLVGLMLAGLLVLIALRWVNPAITPYFLASASQQTRLTTTWLALDDIPPHVALAVVAAEDQRFPHHRGVDRAALAEVLAQARREGLSQVRGASTITQQTVKNVVLWHGRDPVRKALELPLAMSVETLWGKPRILELYLNVAEMGPALFGIEAAAQHHFGKPAQHLTPREAALIAATLPNPKTRSAANPSAQVLARAAWIQGQMSNLGPDWLAGIHPAIESDQR
ncbi:MAG: monofunctional biosynthetic peptidoglycan transglycosylase [Thioalkalivibrionaceae bacterium]